MPLETPDLAVDPPMEDRAYVRSLCDRGDTDGLFALLQSIRTEARMYAVRYAGNEADADDILQDADIKALRAFREGLFDPSHRLRPWYYTVITNAAIDHSRRNKRHRNALSIDQPNEIGNEGGESRIANLLQIHDDPGADLEETDDMRSLIRAFATLPETHQRLIMGAYVYNNRYRDIAETEGIPLGTVKSRMHQAIKMLGVALAEILEPRRAA